MRHLMVIALISFLFTACAPTYHITSDYERGVNFSAYSTYQLLQHKEEFKVGVNPINRQRIERAIRREMDVLGYRTAAYPDLLVAFFVKTKRVREYDHFRPYYGAWGYRGWTRVYEYEAGTLVIDVIDRKNREVVWHGVASGRIYEDMEDVEKEINKVVRQLFERYAEETRRGRPYASIQ
jgi:hypothetical protein